MIGAQQLTDSDNSGWEDTSTEDEHTDESEHSRLMTAQSSGTKALTG
jgi:hypothetical protein